MAAGTNIVCVTTPRELRKSINMSIIRISRIPQSETCAQTKFTMPRLLENIKTKKEINLEIHLSYLNNGGIIVWVSWAFRSPQFRHKESPRRLVPRRLQILIIHTTILAGIFRHFR